MHSRLPILAFGCSSRVGKDTAARAVCAAIRGAERVAFAAHLKAVSAQLFGAYGLRGEDYYERHPEKRTQKLPKLNKSPVQLWVEVGCKLREVYPDIWIDRPLSETRLNPVRLLVVSDLRFPNEARRVHELGGICVRIDRPDVKLRHGSDDELRGFGGWDAVIENTGTVADLEAQAVAIAKGYLQAFSAVGL